MSSDDRKRPKPKMNISATTADILRRLDTEPIQLRDDKISSREGEVRGWLKKFLVDGKIAAARKLAQMRFSAARLEPPQTGGVLYLSAGCPLHEWSGQKAREYHERELKRLK